MLKIEPGIMTPCVVIEDHCVVFSGTHTACQRYINERRGEQLRIGFEWQPGNTPGSMRYTKNGIVLARYWKNDNNAYQIAIFLPIRSGGMKSTFHSSWDAAKAIETNVAAWFEQVNAAQ